MSSSGVPLEANYIKPYDPGPGPLDQYGKVMQLKSLMQGQQLQQAQLQGEQQQQTQRAQLFPSQLQQSQAAGQEAQLNVQDRQGISAALKDSYTGGSASNTPKPAATSTPNPAALNPAGLPPTQLPPAPAGAQQASTPSAGPDRFNDFLTRVQDPKYGVSPQAQIQLIKQFNDAADSVAKTTSDQLKAAQEAHSQIAQGLGSVLSAAPEDRAAQWTLEYNKLLRDPNLSKYAQGISPQYPGDAQAQQAMQGMMVSDDFVKWAQQRNEGAGQAAKSQQAVQAAAAPNPTQLQNATQTLASYSAIPPNMRAGLTAEMKNAPDVETLQKIQARADAAQESFQRSADARTQANAMKDVAVGQVVAGKLVTEDQKLGTALDQTTGIRQLLDMSKGGNQTATPAAMTRFAEHEIVEGGVKRMTQTELNALTLGLGSYGRQFQAWVDKGFQGKMPEATNQDMQTILDAEDKSANVAHDRNVGYIQNRYAGVGTRGKSTVASNSAQPTTDPFAAFGGRAHPN
jgi:hypothetical protein